jgi:hypothetical protein
MAQTRPRLEQIVFKSAKTGSHSIDTYLENAEIGNRTLAQLMGDLFDASGNFAPEDILPEFRIDQTGGQTKLQYRTDDNAAFQDLIGFFNDRGTFATGTAYNALDLVTVDDGTNLDLYIVKADLGAFSAVGDFTGSASTQLITTNSAGILQDVRDARDDVLQDAGFIAVSTDLQATPSKIETVSDNLGTNQAVTVVADDLNLGGSSKIAAVNTNIANVNTTAGSIANVNTVAAQLTPTGDVTVVADDLDLGASSKITQTADNIADVNTVGGAIAAVNTVSGQIGAGLDVTIIADDLDLGASSKITQTADNIANVNAVGTDLLAATSAITTVANDLNATPSNIANFVGGLDATINDLTLSGVAVGNSTSGTSFDLTASNNHVWDLAGGNTLTIQNAHLAATMQPFTIAVKEDGTETQATLQNDANYTLTVKAPDGTLLQPGGNSGNILVYSGFVLETGSSPNTATLVISAISTATV